MVASVCGFTRSKQSIPYRGRSYLGRAERGGNPTLEKIYEIARALDINPQDLLPNTV